MNAYTHLQKCYKLYHNLLQPGRLEVYVSTTKNQCLKMFLYFMSVDILSNRGENIFFVEN